LQARRFNREKFNRLIPYLALILLAVTLCTFIQFSYGRLQQDDYYHIRFSRMLRERGLFREFPWAKHTDLEESFADLYFLYHVLLLPFSFGDLILMGKIAGIFFAVLAFLSLFWFLKRHGIRYALFWSFLFLFGSNAFLIRQLAVRPISLSVVFYVIGTHCMIKRKYLWLILVSYLFVLTYTAFPLFVVVVLLYTVVFSLHQKKLDLRPTLYSLGGTILGIIANPYFPNNLNLLVTQVIKRSLMRSDVVINLEWMPLSSWALLLATWGILLALFLVILLTLLKKRELSVRTVFLFVQSSVFLLAYLKFARGVDQFVPFAILFCASAFHELEVDPNRVSLAGGILSLILAAGINTYLIVSDLRSLEKIDNSKSAVWLRDNTPEGSEVFLTNYGAFPELFFYNTHNVYTFGHDPIFLKEHDKRLFERYLAVLQMRDDPYPIIKEEFGASFVHIENLPQNRQLYRYLQSSPGKFERVYQDDYAAVFQVNVGSELPP
jgi:hypothetical protein